MRILVTRPEPEASRLRLQLEAMGHEATVAPLLSVSFDDPDPIDLSEAQAVIVTSRTALAALKRQPNLLEIARGLPLFAVGQATARDAQALGFETIIAGAGTGQDLLPEITATLDAAAGPLVHFAGDALAVDLAGELRQLGFQVDMPVVYRMLAAREFAEDAFEQFAMGEIEGVILLSPRTAEVYVELVKRQGLTTMARRMTHYCLSVTVARRLLPLGTLRIEIAASPRLEEVLALVA